MNLITFCMVFVHFFLNAFAYIEYVDVSNCANCTIMLTCRHLNSVIAVFNATFEPSDENSTYIEDLNSDMPLVHPRLSLNRRCSGVNHCSFILTKDSPGAERWGAGNFSIKYACVAERRIIKYCNDNITLPSPEVIGVSEGFIRNPGYPKFYLGLQDCRWIIQAPAMQRVKVTILDLSLICASAKSDLLEIKESDNTVFASCLDQELATEIVSLGDALEIVLRASENITARRGLFFYYTAVGCPTPESPKNGYLIYRNDTDADFSCCVGHVFSDTLSRYLNLKCLGHVWNSPLPLPDCILNQIQKGDFATIGNSERNVKMAESFSDVMVPSIIILALFVINSIVVFVIYRYKKRKTALCDNEEELGSMSLQANGNSA